MGPYFAVKENNRPKIHRKCHAKSAKCRRCGELKPIEAFAAKNQRVSFKCLPTACADCKSKCKKRHKSGPMRSMRNRFRDVMRKVRAGNLSGFTRTMGCSHKQFRNHLQSQFKQGMTWNNYGTKWQVDHILPVASFDHTDSEQVKKCWHYSNLRPLCAIENNKKRDKIITCQPELLLQLV